jgi:hypothetical protein
MELGGELVTVVAVSLGQVDKVGSIHSPFT